MNQWITGIAEIGAELSPLPLAESHVFEKPLLILPLVVLLICGSVFADRPNAAEEASGLPGFTEVERGTKIKDIKSDPFTMTEVTIDGAVMRIKVNYAGGHKDHDFTLYWSGDVKTSDPPQADLYLKHNAHGDMAEALLMKTLKFNLANMIRPVVITVHTDHGGKDTVTLSPPAGGVDEPNSASAPDEFDLVTRKHLEDLFAKPRAGKNFVEGKLSRDSYNAKQKGALEKLLKEERKGLGAAFFLTNGGNYGKLLYTWGVGPKLHLKEVVVFRAEEDLFLKSIVIGPAGHLDLDTGSGSHKPGALDAPYKPDLHFSNVDGETMLLSETDGARLLFPMKLIRPKDKPREPQDTRQDRGQPPK